MRFLYMWKFIHGFYGWYADDQWKICLIFYSLFAVVLRWQVVLLWSCGTDGLGILIIALWRLLIDSIWCLGIVIVIRLLLMVLTLLRLFGCQFCLKLENSLTFSFNFGGNFLLQFNLFVILSGQFDRLWKMITLWNETVSISLVCQWDFLSIRSCVEGDEDNMNEFFFF